MTQAHKTIAVLTGDLVNSTGLGPEKVARAFAALEASARTQEDWHRAPLHFTRHRGDGWQVVLARPELALRSALAFRAALREQDTDARIAVASGEGPSPDALKDSLAAQTEAIFVTSGRNLDAMKAGKTDVRMTFEPDGATCAAFVLADHIARTWTTAQALAMRLMLDPDRPSFTDIAERLGKSRQAVSKALYSAGIEAIIAALIAIEAGDESL